MCPLAPASEIASSHSPATLLPQAIPAHVVPEGATITVAGAATSIGRQLIQALTDAGRDWKARSRGRGGVGGGEGGGGVGVGVRGYGGRVGG